MSASNYRLRRATLDDLPELGQLLDASLLPAAQLEKRFTEFQVLEAPDGKLVGAMGLQVAGKHGKIHSESYLDFGLTDTLRPMLWERFQSVAATQGLLRFWTLETAPFWKQAGFEIITQDLRQKIPAAFGAPKADWLTLKLKDDIETVLSLDDEFSQFMQAERERTEKMFAQAKTFQLLAYFLAFALFIFVMVGGFLLLKKRFGWSL